MRWCYSLEPAHEHWGHSICSLVSASTGLAFGANSRVLRGFWLALLANQYRLSNHLQQYLLCLSPMVFHISSVIPYATTISSGIDCYSIWYLFCLSSIWYILESNYTEYIDLIDSNTLFFDVLLNYIDCPVWSIDCPLCFLHFLPYGESYWMIHWMPSTGEALKRLQLCEVTCDVPKKKQVGLSGGAPWMSHGKPVGWFLIMVYTCLYSG